LRALKAMEASLSEEQRILQGYPVPESPSPSQPDAGTQRIPTTAPSTLPACDGIFPSVEDGTPVGTSYLQESINVGIGWQVLLAVSQAPMGIIRFDAQITAAGYVANAYEAHTELWTYAF